jgi:hypothetical protein
MTAQSQTSRGGSLFEQGGFTLLAMSGTFHCRTSGDDALAAIRLASEQRRLLQSVMAKAGATLLGEDLFLWKSDKLDERALVAASELSAALPPGAFYSGITAGECRFQEANGTVINIAGGATKKVYGLARIARKRNVPVVIDVALDGQWNTKIFSHAAPAISADPGPVNDD